MLWHHVQPLASPWTPVNLTQMRPKSSHARPGSCPSLPVPGLLHNTSHPQRWLWSSLAAQRGKSWRKISSLTIHSLDMEKYFMEYLLASLERSHNVPFFLSWFLSLTLTFATRDHTSWWILSIKLYWVQAFLGIQAVSNTFPCTWDAKDISEWSLYSNLESNNGSGSNVVDIITTIIFSKRSQILCAFKPSFHACLCTGKMVKSS